MGQAERLPCHVHCHRYGDRPVRAPIPGAPGRIRSRSTKNHGIHSRSIREAVEPTHRETGRATVSSTVSDATHIEPLARRALDRRRVA